MCRLVESLKILDGRLYHTSYHNARMNASRRQLFRCAGLLDLEDIVRVPEEHRRGLYKCRVIYGNDVHAVEFHPYVKRTVCSLRLLEADDIDYSHKYENRDAINDLLSLKGDCGDVLIIKQGEITDASSANVALFDGYRWVTPLNPLLKGTCRSRLIDAGILAERRLCPQDLRRFTKLSLINAMMDLGEWEVPVDAVVGLENFM